MTKMRPSLCNGTGLPLMSNGTAYMMILSAVNQERGLVHGKLHEHGQHCAIGSYFETNEQTALPSLLIDEVASVNDSVPHLTNRRRRLYVAKWLRWKLGQLNFPGYKKAKAAR